MVKATVFIFDIPLPMLKIFVELNFGSYINLIVDEEIFKYKHSNQL